MTGIRAMELDGMISPTEAPASPTSPAEVASTIFPQSEWPPTICPEDFEEVPTIAPGLAEPEITEERRERVKRRLEWSTPHTMRSMPTHPHDHRFVPTPGNPAEARLRKILDKKNERETKRKAKKREANRRWNTKWRCMAVMWKKVETWLTVSCLPASWQTAASTGCQLAGGQYGRAAKH